MRFKDFAGNTPVKNMLTAMIRSKRIPNSVLFEGEAGTGKTLLARIFANALVCRGESKPCGACRDCVSFEAGGHPDIINVTGSGKTGAISVDAVRDISDSVGILPNQAAYKVYFIDDAGKMTPQAQNALLKVLEEPPQYVVFIMTCRSKFELLPTVLSRTIQFTLFPPAEDEAVNVLKNMLPSVDLQLIKSAVRQKGCLIGEAAKLLSEGDGGAVHSAALDVVKFLKDGNEYKLMMCLSAFNRDREAFERFIRELKLLFRDTLIMITSSQAMTASENEAERLSEIAGVKEITSLIGACDRALDMIDRNINYQLVLTLFGSELWTALHEA